MTTTLMLLRDVLLHFVSRIDNNDCNNISTDKQSAILSLLLDVDKPNEIMSKLAACDYLGISRSTFDNKVHDGYIPKGKNQYGFKELSWNKIDLDLYKAKW